MWDRVPPVPGLWCSWIFPWIISEALVVLKSYQEICQTSSSWTTKAPFSPVLVNINKWTILKWQIPTQTPEGPDHSSVLLWGLEPLCYLTLIIHMNIFSPAPLSAQQYKLPRWLQPLPEAHRSLGSPVLEDKPITCAVAFLPSQAGSKHTWDLPLLGLVSCSFHPKAINKKVHHFPFISTPPCAQTQLESHLFWQLFRRNAMPSGLTSSNNDRICNS